MSKSGNVINLAEMLEECILTEEYWGKKPVHIPDCHSDLSRIKSWDDIFEILPSFVDRRVRAEMRSGSQGKIIFKTMDDLEQSHTLFADGWSFHSPAINLVYDLFCEFEKIESQLSKIVQLPLSGVSLFVSPPHSEALPPHHDDEDVFTFQIHGEKTWKMYSIVPPKFKVAEPEPDTIENMHTAMHLSPGDLGYIPRGMIHSVSSSKELSVSLCIAYRALDWAEHIGRAIAENLRKDLSFATTYQVLGGKPISQQAISEISSKCAELFDGFDESTAYNIAETYLKEQLL